MGKPTTPTQWIPPLDELELGGFLPKNDNAYRMKRSVSPANERDISAVIVPIKINVTITNGITPSVTPRPKKAKLRKKKCPQMTRPSKTA